MEEDEEEEEEDGEEEEDVAKTPESKKEKQRCESMCIHNEKGVKEAQRLNHVHSQPNRRTIHSTCLHTGQAALPTAELI